MASKAHVNRIQPRIIENNEPEFGIRYPNLVYFHEKFCTDCEKNCEFPSMDAFGCMIKKLSNKKNKEDGKK